MANPWFSLTRYELYELMKFMIRKMHMCASSTDQLPLGSWEIDW